MSSPYTPPPPPPTAPPPETPGGKASIGMDANIASMICYLTMICCGLGIILSLVFFIIEKTSRLLKFHAMQALLFGALWVVLGIVFRILYTLTSVGLGGEAAGAFAALAVFGAQIVIALIL